DVVAAQVIVRQGHRRGRGGVVGLVLAGGGYRQRRHGDVRGRRCCCVLQRVVTCIGAADTDAADVDRLGRPHVLIVEQGTGVAVGHLVAAQVVVGQRHRRCRGGAVGLVLAGGGHRQGR